MFLLFLVDHQKLTRVDELVLAENSVGFVNAHFEFTSDWDGFAKTALFRGYEVILDQNNNCVIPWEALDDSGHITVSVYGVKGAVRVTTDILIAHIEMSGYKDGQTSKEPTADVYSQLISNYETVAASNKKLQSQIYEMAMLLSSSKDLEGEVRGTSIVASASAEKPFKDFTMYGKSKQITTTGKNLLDGNNLVIGGLSAGIEVTSTTRVRLDKRLELAAGAYTVSCSGIDRLSVSLYENKTGDRFQMFDYAEGQITFAITSKCYIQILLAYKDDRTITSLKGIRVQVESGTPLAAEYEPYSGGKPSPSPDYPQSIDSVENPVVTVRGGKNLFPNGTLAAQSGSKISMTLTPGTYTISYQSGEGALTLRLNHADGTSTLYSSVLSNGAKSKSIVVKAPVASFNYSISGFNNSRPMTNVQLETGDTVTAYEPYRVSKATISNLELYSVGDVYDELIVHENGTGEITRRCAKYDFDGTETIDASTQVNNRFLIRQIASSVSRPSVPIIMCDTFRAISFNDRNSDEVNTIYNEAGTIGVKCGGITSVSAFKTLLSNRAETGNPVSIVYPLKAPTTEKLTEAQLKALLSIGMLKSTTVIVNDQDAEMDVHYAIDPKLYLDKKFDEMKTET